MAQASGANSGLGGQRLKSTQACAAHLARKRRTNMSTLPEYPYDTRLNLLHQHLELIDEKALAQAAPHPWYNQTLCQVNASVVRLGVVEGEYHWHKHDNDDEFFYVVEGTLLIDLEGRTVELASRQGFVV